MVDVSAGVEVDMPVGSVVELGEMMEVVGVDKVVLLDLHLLEDLE